MDAGNDQSKLAGLNQGVASAKARLGIASKLFLAFGIVGLLAVLCAAVGLYGFAQVRTAQNEVVDHAVPAMADALRLAELSATLAATAPLLAASDNDIERSANASLLASNGVELKQLITELEQQGFEPSVVALLTESADALLTDLDLLDEATRDRLRTETTIAVKLQTLQVSETTLMKLLTDQVNLSVGEIDDAAGSFYDMAASGKIEGMSGELDQFFDHTLDRRIKLLELRQTASDILGALRLSLSEPEEAGVTAMASKVTGLEGKLTAHVSIVADPSTKERLGKLAAAVVAAGKGDAGLFAQRQALLKTAKSQQALLQSTRQQADALSHAVATLVTAARSRIGDAGTTANQTVQTGQRLLIGLAALALVVAVAIAWLYVGRVIAARLTKLAATMRAIAGGDLDTEIPATGKDEIRAMADALVVFRNTARAVESANRRAEQERMAALQQRQAEQEAMANRFEASVARVVQTVITAAAGMRDTATGMAATASQTTQASSVATNAADQATQSVNTVAAAAEQLAASVAEISRRVTESSSIASAAAHDATRTNDIVAELETAAARIGDVVKLINDIAEQTNLLALNATIEAARAGEAGKGFAVVAGEVKNLAGQTAKATGDIDVQVRAMQATAQQVVRAIQTITGTIGRIDQISSAIAGAVQQQGAATNEIASSAQSAAQGTTQASAEIISVRAAADQTGQSANAVLEAAQQMAGLANTLQGEVDQFLQQVRAA